MADIVGGLKPADRAAVEGEVMPPWRRSFAWWRPPEQQGASAATPAYSHFSFAFLVAREQLPLRIDIWHSRLSSLPAQIRLVFCG